MTSVLESYLKKLDYFAWILFSRLVPNRLHSFEVINHHQTICRGGWAVYLSRVEESSHFLCSPQVQLTVISYNCRSLLIDLINFPQPSLSSHLTYNSRLHVTVEHRLAPVPAAVEILLAMLILLKKFKYLNRDICCNVNVTMFYLLRAIVHYWAACNSEHLCQSLFRCGKLTKSFHFGAVYIITRMNLLVYLWYSFITIKSSLHACFWINVPCTIFLFIGNFGSHFRMSSSSEHHTYPRQKLSHEVSCIDGEIQRFYCMFERTLCGNNGSLIFVTDQFKANW